MKYNLLNLKINKNITTVLLYIVIMIFALFLLLFKLDSNGIWYDEAFTSAITNHNIIDIIKLTANDNHPPLYYLIVKFFRYFFGNSVFSLRLVSVFGELLLIGLGIVPVRKIFGNKISFLYCLYTAIFPIFISFSHDARMYTFTCFFVTASALYCYLACLENKIANWIITSLFSLLAAYTHVYGFIAVFFIYLTALIWTIVKYKNKIIFVFISVFFNLMAYLPWMIITFFQFKRILKNFWIPPVDLLTFFMLFQYIYTDKFFFFSFSIFSITGGLFLILIISNVLIIIIKNKFKTGAMPFFALLIIVGSLLTGLLLSIILKPVFLPRFLFVTFGLLVIIISYGISILKNKYIRIISFLLIIILALPQIFLIYTKNLNSASKEASDFIKQNIKKDDVFIHQTEQSMGVFYYYFPNHKHFLYLKRGFTGYSNYNVFKPNLKYGPDLPDEFKNTNRFWITNYIEHFNIIPNQIITHAGNFKKTHSSVFISDNLFNTISAACYEKTDLIINQKKGIVNIKITNIKNDNKKGQIIVRIYNHILFEYRNALIKAFLNNKADIIIINNKIILKKIEKYLLDELINNDANIIFSIYKLSDDKNYYILNEKSLTDDNRNNISNTIDLFEKKYSKKIEIFNDKAQYEFTDLPFGEYTTECFYDKNKNNFLDYRGLKLIEGYGISGNTNNIFPDFEINSFMINADKKEIIIELRYY